MIVCSAAQKPLVLFHLIRSRGVQSALVFTKSTDSTTRLVHLFELLLEELPFSTTGENVGANPVVAACSSDLPASERRAMLEKFKTQEINM
jgi:ATP-dependent RNA helicase DDX51/DBP6